MIDSEQRRDIRLVFYCGVALSAGFFSVAGSWAALFLGLVVTAVAIILLKAAASTKLGRIPLYSRTTDGTFLDKDVYKTLYLTSPDAIMIVEHPSGHFVAANTAAIRMFGFTSEADLIGNNAAIISPERQPDGGYSAAKSQKMAAIAVENGTHLFEWMHRKKDGTTIQTTVLLSVLSRGKPTLLQVRVRDISGFKTKEDELVLSNKGWLNIFNAVTDAMLVLDKEHTIIRTNKAFLESCGVNEADIIGRKCYDVVHKQSAVWPNCPHAQTVADMQPHTEMVDDPDTGKSFLISTSPLYNERDVFIGSVHIARDITNIKKIQSQVQESKDYADLILRVTPSALFTVDCKHIVTSFNKKAEQITGYMAQEVIGKSCRLFALEPCTVGCAAFDPLMVKPISNREGIIVRKDGAKRVVSKNVDVLRDSAGAIVGSIESFEDVTDRKESEMALMVAKNDLEVESWGLAKANEGIKLLYKELEDKNLQLSRLDQLKSDFVSTVSHELRTPLATMKEFASILLDEIPGKLNSDQAEYMGIIRGNIDRLSRLIHDLLDISKIEAGKVELKKSIVDLAAEANSVIASLKTHLDKKRIKVHTSFPDPKVYTYADADRMVQIFTNLVTNSYKFTPEHGEITVAIIEKKDHIECSVADTGPGISQDNLAKLFTKFQQFDRVPGSGMKGTGLGLAITKDLVELHKGRIWAESVLGRGSRFVFTLPKYSHDMLLKEYIDDGIKKAVDKDSKLSLIVVSIAAFEKLKHELPKESVEKLLKDMHRIIKESLRREGDEAMQSLDDITVVLALCDKNGALSVQARIKQGLNDYLAKKELAQKIELRFGLAVCPDEGNTEEELMNKAQATQGP